MFTNLDSDVLLEVRGVCHLWNEEACRAVGKRRDYELSWGGGDDANHVKELKEMIKTSQNPKLFNGCSIENSHRFKMARPLFEDFGINLRHVDLDLGIDFAIHNHVRSLSNIFKLATEWGPNIRWLLVTIPIDNLKKLSPRSANLSELYLSKYVIGKVTKLEHLELHGLTGLFKAEFFYNE